MKYAIPVNLVLPIFWLFSCGFVYAETPTDLLEVKCDQFETPTECGSRRDQSISYFNKLVSEHSQEVQAGVAHLVEGYNQENEIFQIKVTWRDWVKKWEFSLDNSIRIKLQDAKELWNQNESRQAPVFIYMNIQQNNAIYPKYVLFGLGKEWEFVNGYISQCEDSCGDFNLCNSYSSPLSRANCSSAWRSIPYQYTNTNKGKLIVEELLKRMNLSIQECDNLEEQHQIEIQKNNECTDRLKQCRDNCDKGLYK